MDGEYKFWLSLWLGLAAITAIGICTVVGLNVADNVLMAKQGYELRTQMGCAYPRWMKAEED